MTTTTALTLPERAALALDSSKTEAQLRELVKSTADLVEVLNPAARDQIHSAAMVYRGHRVTIEKTGKASRDDATKFSKAVIAEEARLVDIISPEEKRLLALRDEWDDKIEAAKQAKIAAERSRIEAIQARIKQFSDLVLTAAGKPTSAIEGLQEQVAEIEITEVDFEEFIQQATAAKAQAEEALMTAYGAAKAAEDVVEAARIKREEEDRQRAAEATENARIKADLDRQAAEQAAERQKLADAAEAQRQALRAEQEKADAARKAEDDERACVAAKAAADLAAQQAAFAAERQAFEDQKAAAAKTEQDRIDAEAKAKADKEAAEKEKAAKEAEEKARAEYEANAEADRIAAEAAQRQADTEHKAKINSAALAAFVAGGMTEECAKLAVTLIASGKIPAVAIVY